MKRNAISQFIIGTAFLILFILFTGSLKFVSMQPIGPNGSSVAYAGINYYFHRQFPFCPILYTITDWAGVAAILIALCFAMLGLMQWIKRKKIRKVDRSILILGIFYILIFSVYVFFEYHVVNYRPVLINGILEASYPSSTTMLTICVLSTAVVQFRRLIQNPRTRNAVTFMCYLFIAFTVIGRVISGVHWFTDIIGGVIISIGAVLLYRSAISFITAKENSKNRVSVS